MESFINEIEEYPEPVERALYSFCPVPNPYIRMLPYGTNAVLNTSNQIETHPAAEVHYLMISKPPKHPSAYIIR
jgi:hypothetical protein